MNVVAAAWLTVSSIQVAIWVLICVIGWRFAYPFWLWTAAGGAVVIAAMSIWPRPVRVGGEQPAGSRR
jgi:hypothetical protein